MKKCFYRESAVLTYNSRSGSKLAFYIMLANYLEYSLTHDTYVDLVADNH